MSYLSKTKRAFTGLSIFKKIIAIVFVSFLVYVVLFPSKSFHSIKNSLSYGKQISLGLTTSVSKNDIIKIRIEEEEANKLIKYREKRPVTKKWIKIKILINGKYWDAKLKYHGSDEPHYENEKFSYTIKLLDSVPLINGIRRFKLIKSEEAKNIISSNYLGSEAGLISAAGTYKMLEINSKNAGSYYFVEDIKKQLLERDFGITNYTVLVNTNDWTRKEGRTHSSSLDLFIGHIEKRKDLNYTYALAEFESFLTSIQDDEMNSILNFIDMKYMSKYLALLALFNDPHDINGDNLKFIYDFSRGKFYPIYRAEQSGIPIQKQNIPESIDQFNKLFFESRGIKYSVSKLNKLFKILISNNSIRADRDKYLYQLYLKKNDILSSIDSIHNSNISIHHSEYRYRSQKFGNRYVKNVVNTSLDFFHDYISEVHIYGSVDTNSKIMDIALDAFAPIKIVDKFTGKIVKVWHGIEFDSELNYKNILLKLPVPKDKFNPKKDFIFINTITGDTVPKQKLYFNYISRTDYKSSGLLELEKSNVNFVLKEDSILIKKGKYQIKSQICLPKNLSVVIEAGVTLELDSNIHFQINGSAFLLGTPLDPILIKPIYPDKPFGTFSIIGDGGSQTIINNIHVSGGKNSFFNGKLFSGQFAIYESNVDIKNSSFSESQGDDGLNIKYSKVNIENCSFINNFADQVDLDFCFAKVSSSIFYPQKIDANGDGLDLSGSYVKISDCSLTSFLDKGLSLGEKSTAIVTNCQFKDNANAIAVKDETSFYCWNNTFSNNKIIFTSFIKKNFFNEPNLFIDKSYSENLLNIVEGKVTIINENEIKEKLTTFEMNFKGYEKSGSIEDRNF
ncbi:MAG: right-handed parallel beta-helix repeat-containing protein [Crocinitomicaceae bacterium]